MPDEVRDTSPLQETAVIDDDGSALPVTLRVEAAVFSADRSIADAKLAEVVGIDRNGAAATIRAAVEELNDLYASMGRSFRIERLADGWQVLTQPEFAPIMARLHQQRQQSRLSQAALETLAIIAYRQPVMRAEIEAIRGVACGEVLRGLLERRMIRVTGRAEELGRPMLYGTTKEFLRLFGVAGLGDLPDVQGLERSPSYRPPRAETESPTGEASEASDDRATPDAPDAPDASEPASQEAGERAEAGADEATPVEVTQATTSPESESQAPTST
jgi:segregation and condensation protein B